MSFFLPGKITEDILRNVNKMEVNGHQNGLVTNVYIYIHTYIYIYIYIYISVCGKKCIQVWNDIMKVKEDRIFIFIPLSIKCYNNRQQQYFSI